MDVDWSPPVVLEIFDRDSGTFDSDDFIGRSVINLLEAAVSNDDSIPRPKWHPVKLGFREDEPVMGQILVSFSVLNPKKLFKKSLNDIRLRPHCEEYEITINVLGLRELESPGILPIRKAFINFCLRSLLPPSKAHAIENIQTQPSATGRNPTVSTVIKFNIYLPNDPLYCPSLTCGVYDYIFKGWSQPLVGNFVIPIGELQHFQDEQFEAADGRTLELIKSLEVKINDAAKLRPKLEEQKNEAEAEMEKEIDLQKVKLDQQEQKVREELALKTAEIGKRIEEEKVLEIDVEDIGRLHLGL